MTESQVVNEWISQSEAKGSLSTQRRNVLQLLSKRFPGAVPEELTQLVNEQESLEILRVWFDAAAEAYTFQQFFNVVKR